jgi:hypothetical protein
MKKLVSFAVLGLGVSGMGAIALSSPARAASPTTPAANVQVLHHGRSMLRPVSEAAVVDAVRRSLDLSPFRQAKVEVIDGIDGKPDHLVVHLLSRTKHHLEFARLDVDAHYNVLRTTRRYGRSIEDREPQRLSDVATSCPDPSVQFLAFCPNDDQLELDTTNGVADFAEKKGLKTVRLLQTKATRQAYLDYMSCPNLLGNFYDGDSDPSSIVVYDGTLDAEEFEGALKGKFQLQTTNIWVACEAYNDPMLSSVQKGAKAKKYAAGINDLEVGPSDAAAACAMEAAISGDAMTAAFQKCYKDKDTTDDQWGFGGDGTDTFWK